MKSSAMRRTTIVVVACALMGSVAMGALVGQLGRSDTGGSEEIASPPAFVATPVGTPGEMPPFFGLENGEQEPTVFRPGPSRADVRLLS